MNGDRDLQWSGLASSKRGRSSLLSDAAIQFCLTIKSLFGLALRQAIGIGMVESLLKLAGLSWQVPDFDRQVAELQVRAAILNRFTQLGTPEMVRMG